MQEGKQRKVERHNESRDIFFFFFNYFNQAYLRDGETDLVEKRMNDVREKEGMITVTKSLSR